MDNDQLNYRLDEFFRVLTQLVGQGKEHNQRLGNIESGVQEIKSVQKEQTQILNRLDSKTDSIAETVLNHERRIIKTEQNIENLQGGVH